MNITISGDTYSINRLTETTEKLLAIVYHVAHGEATDTTDKLMSLALMSGILAGDIETNGQTVADNMLNGIRARLA